MVSEVEASRRRAGYFEAQQAALGSFSTIFSKIFSFLTGGDDQRAVSQPLLDLVSALRQFMQAPSALEVPAFKNQQHKATFFKMCEANKILIEKQLGLSRTIVAKDDVFSIRAFSKKDGLALVLFDENGNKPERIGVIEIPEKDLTTGKLNDSLERGLKKLTQDLPDLQTEVMREFHNSSVRAIERKAAIAHLQEATQIHDRWRDTLGFDKHLTTAVTKSWNDAWKAADTLKDLLGISGMIAADGKAYHITPFKNRDTGGFDFVLFDGDSKTNNRVAVSPSASRETIRQAITQLTEGHRTLQDKVLSRFDAATSRSQKVAAESRQSAEQQLSPEAKANAAIAAKNAQPHLHDMQHAGNELKQPTAAAINRHQTQERTR